jgi:hypothetical protein
MGEDMDTSRRAAPVVEGLRPLSAGDLDREIERVAAEVTDLAEWDGALRGVAAGAPVWISTAEFVVRMSRFVCFN